MWFKTSRLKIRSSSSSLLTTSEKARNPNHFKGIEEISSSPVLAANNGQMLLKDARHKMRMSKQSFTNLLAVLSDIESKPLTPISGGESFL